MEKNEHDKIIAFDTLYTNNHIQMLKIVMPYFDEPMRRRLAVYIKYLEFRHTLDRCHSRSYELSGCSFDKEEFNINKICSELLPFCTGDEKKKLGQIADVFRSMEMYKEMSRTMEMMKEFAPDLFTEGFGGIFPSGASPDNPDGSDSASRNYDFANHDPTNNSSINNSSINNDPISNDSTNSNSTNHVLTSSNFANNNNNRNNGIMEMLMGMLSPEQKAMFEMFGGNSPHEPERMDE